MRAPTRYGRNVWRAEVVAQASFSCRCAAIHLLAPYEIARQFTFPRPYERSGTVPRARNARPYGV